MTGTSERTPLAAGAGEPSLMSGVSLDLAKAILVVLVYIALSACLINYNKWLMHHERFPFSIALTWCHMMTSSFFALVLYTIPYTSERLFGRAHVVLDQPQRLLKRLVPLSVAFAGTVVLSNEAYRYCSVPFLQMCKELNVVLVYAVAITCGIERFSLPQATVLMVVLVGCTMAIHGEVSFMWFGFMVQMASQCCEVTKITLQSVLLSKSGFGLDPMTTVLFMCPLCLLSVTVLLGFTYHGGVGDAFFAFWPHLALNCLNAFCLNVSVAIVIKVVNGIGFVLAGILKDILIVSSAAVFFSAHLSPLQITGFVIAVIGIVIHSVMKSAAETTERVLREGTKGAKASV